MPERDILSDLGSEASHRISIIRWVLVVVVSFVLGAFATHFALLQEQISQYSFQEFFMSSFWSTASIALVCFVLGIGFAYIPFAWYREDANRLLRTEYRALRKKAEALLASQESNLSQQGELSRQPPYGVRGESPEDIAAVISEVNESIQATLRGSGSIPQAEPDLRQSPRPKTL